MRQVYVFGPNSKGQIVDLVRSARIVEGGISNAETLWSKNVDAGVAEWSDHQNYTIDLGTPMEVTKIVFVPYFNDVRKYKNVRISVGLEYNRREEDLEDVLIFSQTLSALPSGWIMSGVQEV